MNARLLLASVLVATTLGALGCATPNVEIPEPTTTGDLTRGAPDGTKSAPPEDPTKPAGPSISALAGKYEEKPEAPGEVAQLSLRADGTYGVTFHAVRATDGSRAFVVEEGSWTETGENGTSRLTLRASTGTTRSYDASRVDGSLTIAAFGRSQTLAAVGETRCWDDADCGQEQACAIQVCTMACLPGDPVCCGPRICVAKSGGPRDECAGAWLDESGMCRAPNDGALPAKCCAP